MPFSHHSHSGQFCKHAKGTLEDVVLEAMRQGFELYGLTEHVPRHRTEDLYPEEVRLYSAASCVRHVICAFKIYFTWSSRAPQSAVLVTERQPHILGGRISET